VIFWCGLYSRLVEDKLEQFTDVCSLANISVFAMAQKNFGYYIHGK
jgi:meckelin